MAEGFRRMTGTFIIPPKPRDRKPMKPMKRTDSKGRTRWVARVWDASKPGFRSLGTFDKKGDAQDAITAFYARPRARTRETCDSFATRWADDYPRDRASTNRLNRERVSKFGKDFKGVPMHDIDRPTARAWALENPARLGAVRAMFNDALDDELVFRNPFAALRLPKSKGRKDLVALTEQELDALADKALELFPGQAGELMRATVLVAGYVGIRQGELYALKLADLGHDEITVRNSLGRDGTTGPTKNGKERTVVLLPKAREAIRRVPRRPNQTFVFVNPRDGRPLTVNSHGYYWRQLRAAAGHPSMTWHELRHACATILWRRGLAPHQIAHQLGHTDGGILIQKLYGHPEEALSRAAIKQAFSENVAPMNARRLHREAG